MKYFNLSNTVLLALKDWGRANSNCGATFGGSLAAPSTELENAYIRQQLTEYYAAVNPSELVRVWMGAYEYLNYTTSVAYWRFTSHLPTQTGNTSKSPILIPSPLSLATYLVVDSFTGTSGRPALPSPMSVNTNCNN